MAGDWTGGPWETGPDDLTSEDLDGPKYCVVCGRFLGANPVELDANGDWICEGEHQIVARTRRRVN